MSVGDVENATVGRAAQRGHERLPSRSQMGKTLFAPLAL